MEPKEAFLLIILIIATISISIQARGEISHPHWIPEDVIVNERTIIFVTIITDPDVKIEDARLNISGSSCFPLRIRDVGVDSGLYQSNVVFRSNDTFEVHVEILTNDTWEREGTFIIEVSSESKQKNEKTILGLPSWYCSITVIIITIIVIFLTWAYFKGRTMIKTREERMDTYSTYCSECDRPIDLKERYCPWCGLQFDDDEFVCSKCGSIVRENDEKCGNCGAKLATTQGPAPIVSGRKRINTIEDKMKINTHGKRECGECGTVLMEDEKRCPICGK